MGPAEAQALAKRAAASGLLKVEEAREILAQCRRMDEAKSIRDQAEAIRAYLRQQAASRDAQNDAAEIKLRAERRLGELLIDQKETGERDAGRGGDRRSQSQAVTVKPVTLAELGVEKMAAKRWQDVAKVPEERFEEYIQAQRLAPTGEITTAGLSRLAADRNRSAAFDGDNEDERFTPRELIQALHAAYRFTVDAAGHPASPATKIIQLAWHQKDDGLKESWKGRRVWCNPPFSSCEAWVAKAHLSVRTEGCPLVVMLLPAVRTDQRWWQEFIEPFRDRGAVKGGVSVRVRFLPGRTRYGDPLDPEGENAGSPRFGSVLVMWSTGEEPDLRELELEPKAAQLELEEPAKKPRCIGHDDMRAGATCDGPPSKKKGRCPSCTTRQAYIEKTRREGTVAKSRQAAAAMTTCLTRGCLAPIPVGKSRHCEKHAEYSECREPGCRRTTVGYSTKDGAWCDRHRPDGPAPAKRPKKGARAK